MLVQFWMVLLSLQAKQIEIEPMMRAAGCITIQAAQLLAILLLQEVWLAIWEGDRIITPASKFDKYYIHRKFCPIRWGNGE